MPSTRSRLIPWDAMRRLWPAVRIILIIAVIIAVGWEFARILRAPELWVRPVRLRPGWLAAAAALNVLGLAFPALFWFVLLRALGQRPRPLATVRAYFVGQLGRYIPGKVIGLGLRARLLAGPGVGQGVAILTIVYEALTTLASGVLLGLLLLAFEPRSAVLGWRVLPLLAVVAILLIPAVFNRLAEWTSRPFRAPDASPPPPVRGLLLGVGLALTACGWLLQGGVLWIVVEDLVPGAWPSPLHAWGRCAAYVALAYAAGFLVLASPGGLGVRDLLIQQFLTRDLAVVLGPAAAAATAVVAALLMRLLWTVLDVACAGVSYWLPSRGDSP
jgi:uncharacterized membrane protein YbhN (UPF0104 family)